VTDGLPLPLYHRVTLALRQSVQEGIYAPAAPMPGEHELAAAHGVSRITIRRALQTLQREGLVVRRRGAGTFAAPPPAPAPMRDDLRGLIENLLAMGLRTSVRLLDFEMLPLPADIAGLMGLPPGRVAQRSRRVRSMPRDGGLVPFSHLTAWVPEDIGRGYASTDLASRPLLALLEQSGVKIASATQTISAKAADSVVAPLLEVPLGAALLWVRRQVCDPAGRVMEALEALYRPDLYAYQIGLVREAGLWSPRGP
jgi:GntR family transcriptional regulator